MSEHRDRVLDVQLERLLGGGRVVDLRAALREAWQDELELGPLRVLEPPRPRRPAWTAAAAVLLGIGLLAAAVVLLRDPVLARAEADVLVLDDAGAPRATRDVRAGELVLCPPGRRTRLHVGDGPLLDLEAGAVLRLRRDASTTLIALGAGQLLVDGAVSIGGIDGPARFRLDGRATVRAHTTSPPSSETPEPGEPEMFLKRARQIAQRQAIPTALGLTLLAGSAGALSPTGIRAPIAVGEFCSVDLGGGAREDRLTKDEREKIDRFMDAVFKRASSPDERMLVYKDAIDSLHELARLIRARPVTSAYIRARLLAVDPADDNPEWQAHAIDLLVFDRDPSVQRKLLGILKKKPAAFRADQVMALAEQDLQPAIAELERRVKTNGDKSDLLFPAAHLAMRGNAAGRRILLAELDRRGDRRWGPFLAAAAGLAVLGDRSAWPRAVEALSTEVQKHAAEQTEILIPVYIYMGQYLAQAVRGRTFVPLPRHLTDPIDDYRPAQALDATDPAKVRAALAALLR